MHAKQRPRMGHRAFPVCGPVVAVAAAASLLGLPPSGAAEWAFGLPAVGRVELAHLPSADAAFAVSLVLCFVLLVVAGTPPLSRPVSGAIMSLLLSSSSCAA